MLSNDRVFYKHNIDKYLRELAKEYRKLNGKNMPAEVILIGGASVLANYGFRDATYDVDAIIIATSAMKQAINNVGDKYGLPNGWMNADFMKTNSYSPKLIEYSVYYKTFSNVLTVRTITGEYLIAMKLMSGRKYKSDFSDAIGILNHHKLLGEIITMEKIKCAVENLYGEWNCLPEESKRFIEQAVTKNNYEEVYSDMHNQEITNRIVLKDFAEVYPNVLNENNMDQILSLASKKLSHQE